MARNIAIYHQGKDPQKVFDAVIKFGWLVPKACGWQGISECDFMAWLKKNPDKERVFDSTSGVRSRDRAIADGRGVIQIRSTDGRAPYRPVIP